MHPLNVSRRNKAVCLDERQQDDEENEGEGIFSKSVQPKLTTTIAKPYEA